MTEPVMICSNIGDGFSVHLARSPSVDVIALLSSAVWGSRGMRYRILDVAAKLARLRDPYFFTLERAGQLAAICVLDRCRKLILDQSVDALHFAMLATAEASRQQGCAGLLAEQVRIFCEQTLERPGLAFAYIESTTVFSLRVSDRIGHALEAHMPVMLFSRLRACADPNVGRIEASECAAVAERLGQLYRDHELYDPEPSTKTDEYYVLRSEGVIVAGVQAEQLHWSVESLPGISGWLILHAIAHVPLLSRVLAFRNLSLLRFGNILVEPGHESELEALLCDVLWRHNVQFGLFIMDARSRVRMRIVAHLRMGILARLVKGAVKVRMDFVGLQHDQVGRIAQRPIYASSSDVF